eukprot:g3892.t1
MKDQVLQRAVGASGLQRPSHADDDAAPRTVAAAPGPELHDLARAIKDKRAILFVGAGVSMNLGLPSWHSLTLQMIHESGLNEILLDRPDITYQTVAEYYLIKNGKLEDLHAWLEVEEATVNKLQQSEIHRLIVSLDFPVIYTTNYDRNLEKAYELHGRDFVKITKPGDVVRAADGRTEIVKFHGDFDDPASLVLTESHHFERLFFDAPLDVKLRSDALGKTVLFIGYSMSDINIRLLFYRLWRTWVESDEELARPPSFVFMPDPDPIQEAAINAEARASYGRAAAILEQSDLPQLIAEGGSGIPTETYVRLRRAGYDVSPVIEGDYRFGTTRLRLIGVDPLTMPAEERALPVTDASDLAAFVGGKGLLVVSPTTASKLHGNTDLNVKTSDSIPDGTAFVDISVANRLLGTNGTLSRLVLAPIQKPGLPEVEAIVQGLVVKTADAPSDIARLTDSFHLNLTAFGFLAFVVGLFIVYSAMGLSFEQRRGTFRTLRSVGISLRGLTGMLMVEMMLFALLSGVIGVALGYLMASLLLPGVAATLRGLYGADVSGSLSLRPEWWLAGLLMALLGTFLAAAQNLWRVRRLPILAASQSRSWARASQRSLTVQAAVAVALGLGGAILVMKGSGLIAGFAALACLLLGSALLLPALLQVAVSLVQWASRGVLVKWFWADTRLQLPALSLALMALLLALSANVGVGTMVSSFRQTFVRWLDQRLAAELYVTARNEEEAGRLRPWLTRNARTVLPIWNVEGQVLGQQVQIYGVADDATYREHWPLISGSEDVWGSLAKGEGALVNEQMWRRQNIRQGQALTLPGGWSVVVVGVYSDYGNPQGQVIVGVDALERHYPSVAKLRYGVRLPPEEVGRLEQRLVNEFDLPEANIVDQASLKKQSLAIFEQTFRVTGALNVLTLAVAGFAMFSSLLTLSGIRLPQLAPVWAMGLRRRDLALVEGGRTLALWLLVYIAAIPVGLALAWVLLAVVNVQAFGWSIPMRIFPSDWLKLGAVALLAAALSTVLPIARLAKLGPFDAWIDDWRMQGLSGAGRDAMDRIALTASGNDFAYELELDAQGMAGSRVVFATARPGPDRMEPLMPVDRPNGNWRGDVILVGAGLASALVAARLSVLPNPPSILIIEKSPTPFSGHTWSFHETDLFETTQSWVEPLVAHRWSHQMVRFPSFSRTLDAGYASLTSESVSRFISTLDNVCIWPGTTVMRVEPGQVTVADGLSVSATCVIDAGGFHPDPALVIGYQNFLGLEIETAEAHGLLAPVIMDATVEQLDGYRFLYSLPLGDQRVLVEDTRYSDAPELDLGQAEQEILRYAKTQHWRVNRIIRRESGSLPISLAFDVNAFWRRKQPHVPQIGLKAGLFHPVTGYSLPECVAVAEMIAAAWPSTSGHLDEAIRAYAKRRAASQRFYRLLNRMLFRAASPQKRYLVLQRFYSLPERVIQNFYAARTTKADMLRILSGKPPVPLHKALLWLGGLALAIRLQSAGIDTIIFEKRDKPGGRAYVYEQDGFTFDAGPTVITDPDCLKQLWALSGREFSDYVTLLPVNPFYRLCWEDGYQFDYADDQEAIDRQIAAKSPKDVQGYQRFLAYSRDVYREGYEKLGTVPFLNFWSMVKVAPELIRLESYRSVYSKVAQFIEDEQLRQAFSFHSLLVGGNPFQTSSIYALIHALERQGGVWFAKGGTGALVRGMLRLFQDLGGQVRLNAAVSRISVSNNRADGLVLQDGSTHRFDMIASNADVVHTYEHMLKETARGAAMSTALRKKRHSMSLFVVYFGLKRQHPQLRHHMVLFGPRYRELIQEIFGKNALPEDFSLYLHAPSVTDSGLAPPDCSAYYVLSPVPHLGTADIDWASEGPKYRDKILRYLQERYIPGLLDDLVTVRHFTPIDFRDELNAHLGSAFSVEPILTQSAWFRPHNRDDGSQSFSAAARIFDRRTREHAVMLYAWCRYCDDVIDGQVLGRGGDMPVKEATEVQEQRLADLVERTHRALNGHRTNDVQFDALRRVVQENDISQTHPLDLLQGFRMDVEGRSYETTGDTIVYCYHVAGVVGVMMAAIMGVRSPATLDRASDLGIAFQLTNICRDIIDDAREGRCYIPSALMKSVGMDAIDPSNLAQRDEIFRLAELLLKTADRYYDSAYCGLPDLPFRSAWAIAAARRVYRAIGRKLLRAGPKAWDRRISTSTWEKAGLLAQAFGDVLITRIYRPRYSRDGLFARPVAE